MAAKESKKIVQSRFLRHANILMWKCYLQRQRTWRKLLCETIFATVLFMVAVYIAKPVFLTPLQAEPEPPLTTTDILASLNQRNIVGYAPDEEPYVSIMERAAELLQISIMRAATEYDLNNILYKTSKTSPEPINRPVIWIIWRPKVQNMWKFSIRSTERARYATSTDFKAYPNPHLRAGFLAIQLAVSQAIIEQSTPELPKYELNLLSMPVSPLMQENNVRKALSGILMCFTLALMPPVLETQALVVTETVSKFKRGLRMRGVEYTAMYVGWLLFAYLSALPPCFFGAITLLLIFRWIHLLFAIMLLLSYTTVMIMTALIMAMFHSKIWIACVWSILFTLLQTYLAELLVHHEYDMKHPALTLLLQLLMPPLGLVHALNQFALLQTGRSEGGASLFYGFGSWVLLMILYFTFLMILQSTIGQQRAIGGQVSWKSVIWKKVENVNELRGIETPTGKERDKLQEVDELVARAVSFKNVSKSIMGVKVLDKITLDIYRGEYTMLFAERVQEKIIVTIEDLLTSLTFADKGTINVLGHTLRPGKTYMTSPHMMGYCHRARFLIKDLTVQEHFILFNDICMWQESRQYISQYGQIRLKRLIVECDLEAVRHEKVGRLDAYYHAQLCWALALLVEPRVVLIPYFSDQPSCYVRVIKDKIMQYKKYVTLIQMCFSTLQLENADRVFLFDSKILAFGGTPAYMFFKYGREYRVRMTVRHNGDLEDESIAELMRRASAAGASIRAHLGSLLILRLPASPTEVVATLVQDLMNNANQYGMKSMHISVPDSEEVYRRAMKESRAALFEFDPPGRNEIASEALKRMAEPLQWKRQITVFSNLLHLRYIGWKYFTFHIHYRLYFIITILSAVLAGIFMGLSLSTMLANTDRDALSKKLLHGEKLTMEYLDQNTNLVLRSDNSTEATSLANAYVLSEPNATRKQLKRLAYTALSHSESLIEYLVTRAIDSPQFYVKMYAYGMDVKVDNNDTLLVQALYSPLHKDVGAAARSLAKVYTALLRLFTGQLDASIQVTDDPLALDLTPWMRYAVKPPLFLQFLLILSISHIILIPSMENGLIRHMQSHAMNFSPARYWLTLYFWDLILYWMLVGLMTGVMVLMMFLVAPPQHFQYEDLLVVPFMLILYGFACVPQCYLFSLGPKVALNFMTFVIVNIVFGETTVIAKLFYGEILSFALLLMSLSPQFNMAYAFVKIKQIFLYNSECVIFKTQNLCSNKILHKCCKKCGVLQNCFSRRHYLSQKPGILREVFAMGTIAVIFTTILLLVEYRVVQIVWKCIFSKLIQHDVTTERLKPGAEREKKDVLDKWQQIKQKRKEKVDTFGEYLLAQNLTRSQQGVYITQSVYLGLGKGEALALSGLKRHGRLELVKMLAGYQMPDFGFTCCMSKWRQNTDPHMFARQVSVSCGDEAFPPWMTVYDALNLLALLRGVPEKYVRDELKNLIEALEMQKQADTLVCRITAKTERTRLQFAAAVVGAPPVVVLDECTAHQNYSVRRAMYNILDVLRRRGHAVFISASSVETHLPVTSRLAIMVDGTIYDIDSVDNLVGRYSRKGYTVVLHLKDEVDVTSMFAEYFTIFVINDNSEVLVNVQVLDSDLTWATIFQKMEALKTFNYQVYSYIITTIPIDYIYNSIISNEKGNKAASDHFMGFQYKRASPIVTIKPNQEKLDLLIPFEQKYDLTTLKELPWSVIFQT